MQLKLELQTVKKRNLSISDYLEKIKTLADSLVTQPFLESNLILHILGGLSTKYHSFVTSVTTRLDDISIDDLHAMLQNQEVRLNQHTPNSFTHEPQANVVNITPQFNNRGRGRGCGRERGHGGPSRGPIQNGVKSSVACQLCNRPNHQTA